MIERVYLQIARRIRWRREERGWTQALLARALGVTRAQVANLEAGKSGSAACRTICCRTR